MRFFVCGHCGNLVEMVKDKGVPMMCCGQKMTELVAGTVEAAAEKHIPSYAVEGNEVKVNVGSVDHPMVDEHYIEWVVVETLKGVYRVNLKPEEKPYAEVVLNAGDEVVAVYAYCNLHGLWKA